MESRPDRWEDLERDCLDGYAEGLRQAGWDATDQVPVGYLLSTVLRFGIGSVRPLLNLTLTPPNHDFTERVFGCTHDETVANAAAFLQFQQRRIHQARALLGLGQDASYQAVTPNRYLPS